MCHAAVWVAGDEEQGHGPRFIAELDRLASLGEGGGGRGEPVSRARLCYDRPAAMNRAGAELVAYQPPRPCRLTSVPRKVQDGAH
jgi:hypothetical protein